MLKEFKTILKILASFILLVLVVFLVNEILAFYHNLAAVNPWLGLFGAGLLAMITLGLLLAPVYLYLKLPPPLIFPDEPEEFVPYHHQLRKRLESHPMVKKQKLDPHKDADYQTIQNMFKTQADGVINETATAVFLSTAISQNGKLDAFTVFAAQIRLIWKVAHIYWQRPSMRNLLQLYTNVAVNTLAATGIEQLDLSRQLEPILNAMLKSPGRNIPIVGDAAHMVTDSILEGSINAFLTLRVGVLTRNYCFPDQLVLQDIRRNSFVEASSLLTKLVIRTSSQVVESLFKAGKNISVRTIKTGYGSMERAVIKGSSSISSLFQSKKTNKPTEEH